MTEKQLRILGQRANKLKTAKGRAKIAAQILKEYTTINSRAFDNCFENNDGKQVISRLRSMAAKDTILYNCIKNKCPSLLPDYNYENILFG